MAKEPQAGRVKSRLSRDIGVAAATGFYRHLLTATCRRLGCDPRWQTWLAVTPDNAVHAPVWPSRLPLIRQGSGTLGQRLQHVFATVPVGACLVIGSDIPGITRSDIWQGFRALNRCDTVFGPSADGGYWLVGRRGMLPIGRLFADVRWSSKHTLADTLANLGATTYGFLRQLDDVDKGADYYSWRRDGGTSSAGLRLKKPSGIQ